MFRAYDSTRERLVAIKLFRLDLPPERVHQFVAELERILAAHLGYPALVAPIATGIVDVWPYLAQDYVAAESLDLVVREYGPAPPADAIRVAAQLAGALDFAATVRIAHGALHPRDVLLSSEETRLTGVGIAHALERVGVAPPVRRPYTAPERMAGAAWDRRADVFSLAALMHELLWGRRATGVGAQAAESLTEIPGGDLPALRDAFARALAEPPAERFANALEFAGALHAAFPDVTLARADPQPSRREPQTARSSSKGASRDTQSRASRAEESRLPLDAGADPTLARPVDRGVERGDLPIAAIGAAEAERYRDAEVAPSMVDDESPIADPQSGFADSHAALADPHAATRNPQLFESAFERSRSAVWPLAVALAVGLAVGFAGGYGVGTHSGPDAPAIVAAPPDATPSPAPAPAAAPAAATPAGREFTENAVAAAPKPGALTTSASVAGGNPQSDLPASQAAVGPSKRATRDPQSNTAPGRLLVRSTPAGARVTVDGRDYGSTPLAVRDLTHGPHRVRVTREGYAAAERRIVLTPARPSQSMTFALARPSTAPPIAPATPATTGRFTGTLIVDSRPGGAKVFVDGKLAGNTPLSLQDVRAGEHAIRIERDGYRRWSSSVRVVAAEQNKVTASLER